MVCPVGLDAASASAAVRARLPRFKELPFQDTHYRPIIGASVPELVRSGQGFRRCVPLLVRALQECLARRERWVERSQRPVPLLLVLGGPERQDLPEDVDVQVLREVQSRLRVPLGHGSRAFRLGAQGIFHALEVARQLLARRECDGCLIAAADSLVGHKALHWLERQDRLKTESNSDGVIPSEAAAALWVTRAGTRTPSLLDILGVGLAEEPSVGKQDAANLAEGLAQALRLALAESQLALRDVDFRVGDVTGERTAFMEVSTAFARLLREPRPSFPLWLPAEILGDVGAALPACMLVLTAVGMAHGYAPGHSAAVFASSQGPGRAACVVAAPRRGG
jgi:3-oxoacyl-[acyl-carrier-protein] synthase-1